MRGAICKGASYELIGLIDRARTSSQSPDMKANRTTTFPIETIFRPGVYSAAITFLSEHETRFEIEQSGFLGDQYVSIIPLANKQPALADGSSVRAQSPFNLQEAARSAVGLMQKLDAAATKIDVAVGRDKNLRGQRNNCGGHFVSFLNTRSYSDK